jgi:hypothetical protein
MMAHYRTDESMSRKTNKKLLFYIATLIVLLVVAMYIFVYNKPHRSVRDEEAAFTVSVSELVEAFLKDESRANTLYAGKILQVHGTLREKLKNDSSVILLLREGPEITGVSCYLMEDQLANSEKLQPGEAVSVKGICNGMLMDVVLDQAILLTDD